MPVESDNGEIEHQDGDDDGALPFPWEEGVEEAEGIDEEAEEEHRSERTVRRPRMPSKEERAAHRVSHIPSRPWCRACVRGKGKKRPSLKLSEAYAGCIVPRVRMDYGFLTERVIDEDNDGVGDDEAATDGAGDESADSDLD